MGKGGGKAHTPREAKDNLKSTQLLSVIDAISEGPVEGPVDGLKSVLLNSTPVLDSDALYAGIRSVNTVGKSAFVEAVGRASDDAEGYLDFFKGKITESHLGKELLKKVDLTEDNASRLDEFSKEWKDANDKWNAMWGVKIEQTKDGKHYVAGIGLNMEDTEEGKLSQFLVAANRIAFIDPANARCADRK